MPWARLTLRIPAATAEPVLPAQTRACASPAATACAASTIEASGVDRTARTGSGALAMETGESTICTPSGGSPSSRAGPNSSTRAPWAAARAAPAATSLGPRSAPLASTATIGPPNGTVVGASVTGQGVATTPPPHPKSPRRHGRLVVVIVVVVRVRRDDLAPGVGAAHGADPVGTARTVTTRAGVERGRADLVLRAPLCGPTVGLLLLGDGH